MPGSASNPLLACYQEHYTGLLQFLIKRTGCRETARELVQETWLSLAEQPLDSLPESAGQDWRAYIFTIAANRAIDHQRRACLARERFAELPDGVEAEAGAGSDTVRRHAHREALQAVQDCLDGLPERTRDIFLADRLEGEKREGIARRHGVSLATVEREVMLAMDHVEQAMLSWQGEAVPERRGRRRNLARLLGLGAGTAVLPTLWQAWRHWVPVYHADLASAPGRFHGEALPDGSTVLLDGASAIALAYYRTRRTAHLRQGGAFFAIAPDGARPFTVTALDVSVEVLGTRFAVDIERDWVRVDVESGRVQVRAGDGGQHLLTAGQSLRVRAGGSSAEPGGAGQGAGLPVAPWRDGWLDFQHTPLALVAERLSRYSAEPIRVAPAVGGLPVIARVHIAERDNWLRLLPAILPVEARRSTDGSWRIEARH
ncbi:sigma-70 family RNA polymerase sigma factor [Pseudothauera nasutitermitis]|uniref:Sigma-70 family RNA polymerase sigma factor n=1 Tax=Pseudothauera nasutitermitis TaxID=2565930 RepID=A0A4S4B4V7_9RHOO|nr:sigma-70 family RNA polymerase sigma factor [Pseudothauera nasutitermitis]THF67321.1 sigma-70 family RNA polymerase sigma factor [Pseudothauera nasutitermitis]